MAHIQLYNIDFKKIMESGQCFRILERQNSYRIVAGSHLAYGYPDGTLSCVAEDRSYWLNYFTCDIDYNFLGQYFVKHIDNQFVRDSVQFCKGLRLLKQEPFETLISFIISQRKSIKAISSCIEDLCINFGEELDIGIHAFPTPEALAEADLDTISGLGYRREYVRQAAQAIVDGTFSFDAMPRDYAGALSYLKQLYGVGDKVANCVMLYSLGFNNAFPVDVWVQRILDEHFNGSFPFDALEHSAGILQLYMFYYKRTHG